MATKRTALPAREYTKQEFADAVVRARGERNWSQAKWADHASESLPGKDKVTQADVSQIEKLKSYGLKKAVAVATALEIPPPKKVPDGEAPAPSAAKPRKSRAQQASTPGALAAPTPQQTAATAESPAPASEPA